MIGVARGVAVFAYAAPCDMRKNFDTLSAIVTETLERDVLTGDLYLFVSRNRKRAKVLYFDGTGICLYSKRLEKGLFAAPWKRAHKSTIEMTLSELSLFVEGSEAIGRMQLSPPLLTRVDLRSKFPDATP
ncbi:MAG TPA: IS66 family insertion sequence element accessory protein TnpB [Polyangiaceae bacterium]|jgi:transposase|nr:IS66 family insertion sequence element accessory protein TnpB [Polyangiaceae bacterium]